MAVVGFLLGAGLLRVVPAAYQASTSLLLTPGPYEDVNTAANDNQAMGQTRTVAGLAVREAGAAGKRWQFLGAYKVTVVTERVLPITVTAPVGQSGGVLGECRGHGVPPVPGGPRCRTQQRPVLGSLDQHVNQARQNLSSINAQISQPAAQPRHRRSSRLRRSSARRTARWPPASQPSTTHDEHPAGHRGGGKGQHSAGRCRPAPALAAEAPGPLRSPGSSWASSWAWPSSSIRALVSDRLRRRDDVAQALGAPVKLSVGTVRPNRRLAGPG